MASKRRRRGLGSLFVILGIVAVVGGTFAAGFLAGRHWERVRVVAGLVKPQASNQPGRERVPATKPSEPAPPSLTFYQELTAPLASLPPKPKTEPARPAKAEPPRIDTVAKPEPKPEQVVAKAEPASRTEAPKPEPVVKVETPKPEPAPKADAAPKAEPVVKTEPPVAASPRGPGGFTVQVAAYATRAQAEALAERLVARRFEADVSETTTPNGVRYRVRSGTYPTKDAARDAAVRLGADVRLNGFVTAR